MFKEILLPVDLGDEEASARAVSVSVDYCKRHDAKLHVLAVIPGFSMSIVSQYFPEDFEEKSLAAMKQHLETYIAKNVPPKIKAQAVLASGTVYEEILEIAEKIGCDLIVMAAHRPDLKDFLLGPNAARVVRHAKCSVLVVRD